MIVKKTGLTPSTRALDACLIMVRREESSVIITTSVHTISANVVHNDAVRNFGDSVAMRVHKLKDTNISRLSFIAVKRRVLSENARGKN